MSEDWNCPICQNLLREPVLIGCGRYHNVCLKCFPQINGMCFKCQKPINQNGEKARHNVVLSYLIDQLFYKNEAPPKLTSLLDPLSLFATLSSKAIPYDTASEYSLSVVVQAPERFAISLDFVLFFIHRTS